MAQTIMVTPEVLEAAAKKIQGLSDEYKTQYETLYTRAGEMAQTWSGEDNVAFINQIEGFRNDFQAMFKLMNQYVDYLNKTAADYRATQEAIVKQAKALRN